MFALDLTWGAWIGFSVSGWGRAAGAAALLLVLAATYVQRSRPITDMALMAALWVMMSATGAVLTYLAATCALPLQDGMLTRWDAALGFNWPDWRDAVASRPAAHLLLFAAYDSLMPQILFSYLLLPALRRTERCAEMVLLVALTLTLTAAVSALCPVVGPRAAFGVDDLLYVSHIQTLRASGPWNFDLVGMQGLVTMPSYHTVLAVLFVYAYRGLGRVSWVVGGLNVLMLASIPPIGGHYLMDMIVGGGIAIICIVAVRIAPFARHRRALPLAA